MDLKKIKEIIQLMNEENLVEVEIEEEGRRVKLRKKEETFRQILSLLFLNRNHRSQELVRI